MTTASRPTSFNEVYLAELRELRPGVFDNDTAEPLAPLSDPHAERARVAAVARAENLRTLYRHTHERLSDPTLSDPKPNDAESGRRPLSALCLSGGGIRSATFNLGVIQGLARLGVLKHFDYLSSVSGGGYIASWLKTWMYHAGRDVVLRDLAGSAVDDAPQANAPPGPAAARPRDPLAPEPGAIDRLREYSNYLTPRVGLASPDSWTVAATIVRNLLLNWLVLIPLLAAAIAIPQVALVSVQMQPSQGVRQAIVILALVVELAASLIVHWLRHPRQNKPLARERTIVVWAVLPVYAAAALLSLAIAWIPWDWWTAGVASALRIANDTPRDRAWLLYVGTFLGVWTVAIPVVGWLVNELLQLYFERSDPRVSAEASKAQASRARSFWAELFALLVSGTIAGALLLWVAYYGLCDVACGRDAYFLRRPTLFVILTLPTLLGAYLLARTLFVAISSLGEGRTEANLPDARVQAALDDFDREWWARLSGWVLALAVTWLAFSTLSLVGSYLLQRYSASYAQQAVAALGGISGILTATLGKSGKTSSGKGTSPGATSGKKEISLRVVAVVFILALGALLALGTAALGRAVTRSSDLLAPQTVVADGAPMLDAFKVPEGYTVSGVTALMFVIGVPLLLILVGLLAARVVNVNRFSLHGFYRNRLVRAYLGASNANRTPDPFTGFATTDNIKLHRLWPLAGSSHGAPNAVARPAGCGRPLPVVNTTLNLVTGTSRLAWQLRKADSFSMTPFFCGNAREGYRRSDEYGGREGISLGTAIAISGAAANPNMGYHSSALISFLMTLLNARLGAWLGNTNEHGAKSYTRAGPKYALKPLFGELFGQTDSRHKYVNLSDGGHFDNLGLYEMVLRRCRQILLCDAGRDPSAGFEDLGNAIRKIRVDFGIPIEFEKIQIFPREQGKKPSLFCAIGKIHYAEIDGAGAPVGQLIYIKPALFGHGASIPYDVLAYSNTSADFPHESTSDQWFDEAQFESYRALGLHAVREIGGPNATNLDFPGFFDAVSDYVATATGTGAATPARPS